MGPLPRDACVTLLFVYGSDLPQAPGAAYPMLRVTDDGPSGSLFSTEDTLGHVISTSARDMRIRGGIVPIPQSAEEYQGAGVVLSEAPRIQGFELLRAVAPLYRDRFFATEDEIMERLGRALPLLLRLDEWRQPDKRTGETPADSESFQMLAEVICEGDSTLYRPSVPANTDWTNWDSPWY